MKLRDPIIYCDDVCREIVRTSRSYQCQNCRWILCCGCKISHKCLSKEYWKFENYFGKLVEDEYIQTLST